LTILPIRPLEILRYAQDDKLSACHPERSEGSLVRIHQTEPTHVDLRIYR